MTFFWIVFVLIPTVAVFVGILGFHMFNKGDRP